MTGKPTIMMSNWNAGPTEKGGDGPPEWLDGIADTYCIDVRGDDLVVVDRGGSLYGSQIRVARGPLGRGASSPPAGC